MKNIFIITLIALSLKAEILVHGHRGARALYPENTLPAFDHALNVGSDVLELDLIVTKDNVVVLNHDPFIDTKICRHPSVKIKDRSPIINYDLKFLKQLDCGSLGNKRFPEQKIIPGTTIPTLDEFFVFVKNHKSEAAKKVLFNIETKIEPRFPEYTPSPKNYVKLVYDVIKKHGMQERTILQSFDYRTLKEMKLLDKSVRTSFLNYESLFNFAKSLDTKYIDILSPNLNWITKSEVNELKKRNIEVHPWTANTKEEWDYLISVGVDGIITDNPKALIEYLKSKKLR